MSLLTELELEQKLEQSPAPRVTKDAIESRIKSRDFIRIGETVTMCHIVLDNGYSVRGESACVNPANYNKKIGEKLSADNAFDKLWPLYGFLLAEDNLRKVAPDDPTSPSTVSSAA